LISDVALKGGKGRAEQLHPPGNLLFPHGQTRLARSSLLSAPHTVKEMA